MKVQTVDEYIKTLSQPQSDVVSILRKIVQEGAPEAKESLKDGWPIYDDHGPIVYIQADGDHVKFGFWRGSQLPDPEGLLENEGKGIKYVKFTSPEDIKKKELAYKYFVKIAVRLNREKGDPTKKGNGATS